MKRVIFSLTLLVACSTPERPRPLDLKGPLRELLDPAPSTLAHCTTFHREYVRPFWRAPYTSCGDSVSGGWQGVELDADSVVVETRRTRTVGPYQQRAVWNREAGRLTDLFGDPVRNHNRPPEDSALDGELVRTYCATWRGPDSVEVVLYLDPLTDVGPARENHPWQLRRYARHGPLLGAASCGLRL